MLRVLSGSRVKSIFTVSLAFVALLLEQRDFNSNDSGVGIFRFRPISFTPGMPHAKRMKSRMR